jgi:hypothetical protein
MTIGWELRKPEVKVSIQPVACPLVNGMNCDGPKTRAKLSPEINCCDINAVKSCIPRDLFPREFEEEAQKTNCPR